MFCAEASAPFAYMASLQFRQSSANGTINEVFRWPPIPREGWKVMRSSEAKTISELRMALRKRVHQLRRTIQQTKTLLSNSGQRAENDQDEPPRRIVNKPR
jgi:hypothetical protein